MTCFGDGVAVALITAGCVHEHLTTRQVCAGCEVFLGLNAFDCDPCLKAGHQCDLHVVGRQPLPPTREQVPA